MSTRSDQRSAEGRGVELEVSGSGLLLLAIAVFGLCAASFWLGRWSVHAVEGTRAAAAGTVAVMEDGGDPAEDLTFFDRLEGAPELSAQGDERTVEPPEPEPEPEAERRDAGGTGPYAVQVLASAERAAAEKLLARLLRHDYPARLVTGEKDGRPIYRVRVVGYRDEAAARKAAAAIERQEGLRTWITR